MSNYYISPHVFDQLYERAQLDRTQVTELCQMIMPKLDQFSPNNIHQVAVRIVKLPRAVTVGYSVGDCLILACDIRTRTITTCFVRYASQGIPKAAQVYMTMEGKILQTQPLMSEF